MDAEDEGMAAACSLRYHDEPQARLDAELERCPALGSRDPPDMLVERRLLPRPDAPVDVRLAWVQDTAL
jgi:hypothetical protein